MLRLSVVGIVLAAMFSFVACSGGNGEQLPPSTQEVSNPAPSPEPEASVDETTPIQPEESTPESTDEPATSPPADEETAATEAAVEPEPDDPPAEETAFVVADTKPGLTRIGATKCKMCHKIQYTSWSESEHAALSPPLDCESCHGSGSEYKKKSIMEDPAAARAAGLVMPGADFCGNCHQEDWTDDMLQKSHAHKEDESG